MRSDAVVEVERAADGRTAVRDLRSEPPTRLIPGRRTVPHRDGRASVRMVASAAGPLGGDHQHLHVRVGAGAHLELVGTGATVALPGPFEERSRTSIHIDVESDGALEYFPDETIVSAGANHHAELRAEVATDGRLRFRDALVLGRHAEDPGAVTTATHVTLAAVPLLRQSLDLTDRTAVASVGYLADAKVVATELLVGHGTADSPAAGPWWSRAPLARGGVLATALADDLATATHRLADALDHPVPGDPSTVGQRGQR